MSLCIMFFPLCFLTLPKILKNEAVFVDIVIVDFVCV